MDISGIKIAIISGVFAILGSGVTGYFVVKSNQIIAQKDVKIQTSEFIQSNHVILRKKAEEFVIGVYDYFQVINDAPNAEAKEIRKAGIELQKKAVTLSIYSGHGLGQASIALASTLAAFPDSTEAPEKVADKVVNDLTAWYNQFYVETSSYNLELMPEAFVKKALIQYFTKSDG
ncbi:TPA: hypothetical protein NKS49_004733 [Vibrio parahaemolyticus]|nr:hypothetical protein [Vibrio parahaemolyticus]